MNKKVFHIALRLLFGICLFLSQLASNRTTFFTENPYILSDGVIFIIGSIVLFISASFHLHKAAREKRIAVDGPYQYIRHPIYTGIYILTLGLGLIFFTWLWFVVMIAFVPLWYRECREEEKEMIDWYHQEYIDYLKKTGMFFPRRLK